MGLALSDAEASVVSPFTSQKKTIADVVTLIAEGTHLALVLTGRHAMH
jgi:hypothetical protein